MEEQDDMQGWAYQGQIEQQQWEAENDADQRGNYEITSYANIRGE